MIYMEVLIQKLETNLVSLIRIRLALVQILGLEILT